MKKILLHVCCGPCSTQSIEELKSEYKVTLFFSDSNIYPESEYHKRLKYAKKVAEINNLPLIEDSYDHNKWLNFIKGLEQEKEGEKRCDKCFLFNFKRTSEYAKENNYDFFTTTLTISPYKNSDNIFKIANQFDNFLEKNFKKNNGYKKSLDLSKQYDLYRQDYCGCEFSIRK